MLKNIDPILSSDLLAVLSKMGHGDEIVVADANFPAATRGPDHMEFPGTDAALVVEGIMKYFPLDTRVEHSVFRMEVVDNPSEVPEICEKYQEIIDKYEPGFDISPLKKADFYERSSNAILILRTGERRKFGSLILRKGVVTS